jgi:hypothetical protein
LRFLPLGGPAWQLGRSPCDSGDVTEETIRGFNSFPAFVSRPAKNKPAP